MADNILFVGEGDFSFSANYILTKENAHQKIYATSLNFHSLTDRQKSNIELIENNGGLVHIDVDATCLEFHPAIKDIRFSRIYFNFPHIPGKMNIRNNRKLLQEFFISAEKILKENGTIWVTLCKGQGGTPIEKNSRKWCDTWQIVNLATYAALILNGIQPFDAKEYKIYKCTGFRGLQKPFNTDGALTYIFCHGKSVDYVPLKNEDITSFKIESFHKKCKRLYRIALKKTDSPCLKILHVLNGITKKVFQSIHQVTLTDLLFCPKFSSFINSDVPSNEDYFCEGCLNNLFLQFLNKRNGSLTAIVCSICCVKNINPKNQPFCDFLAYFIDNEQCLQSSIPILLKFLNEEFPLSTNSEEITNDKGNIALNMEEIYKSSGSCTHLLPMSKTCQNSINITNCYASYNITVGMQFCFYTDVRFFLSSDINSIDINKYMKIGTVIKYFHNLKPYFCILLNLDLLACLKFHIMDYRILFTESSYYVSEIFYGLLQDIFRSPSLYPPSYVHDTSFYINQDFCENYFYMIVRNTVGNIISSVTLIDSYYDQQKQKYSRCYRFIYQSCHKALSKERANIIHTKIMRKILEKSLNICLR